MTKKITRISWITIALLSLALAPVLAAPSKLLISEVSVTTNGAEFIEIYNPNLVSVDLTNYYLTDSVDGTPPNYTGITKGTNATTQIYDFMAKFPDGATIAPGQYLVIVANTTPVDPDLSTTATFKLSTLGTSTATQMATPGTCWIGSTNNGLITNGSEAIMLFYWDGVSDLVQDVDYLCWGNPVVLASLCDKSGVTVGSSTYKNDTPVANQKYSSNNSAGNSMQRKQNPPVEGAQNPNGNGVTGEDETSEDMSNTGTGSFIVAAARTPGAGVPSDLPPVISGSMYSPGIPRSTDSVLITATITDDKPGVSATVRSGANTYPMFDDGAHGDGGAGDNVFGVYLPTQPNGSNVSWCIEATDSLPQIARDPSNAFSTLYYYPVRDSLVITSIQTVRNLPINTVAAIRGIVIAQPGAFSAISTEMYVQDASGGIKVFSSFNKPIPDIEGDQVTVLGQVTTYAGEREFQVLRTLPAYGINKDSIGNPLPTPKNITTATLNTDSTIQSTLIKFTNTSFASGWSWASTQSGTRTTKITDGSGNTNMYIAAVTGITDPGLAFDVVGVAAAYGAASVAVGVPEIHPRRQSDFTAGMVVIPAGNLTLHPGNTVAFTPIGGTPPYTWSITTSTGSNIGTISTTGLFTAGPGIGTGYVTVTDSGVKTANSGTISITPTSAPLAPEPKEVILMQNKSIGVISK